jgi:hypothetical protein
MPHLKKYQPPPVVRKLVRLQQVQPFARDIQATMTALTTLNVWKEQGKSPYDRVHLGDISA